MWERSGHKRGSGRAVEVQREQRYIFNGEPGTAVTGYAVRQNRRTERKRMSTFNSIVILFVVGALIVLYIHNIIVVNRLVVEVNALQARLQRQTEATAALQAEVNRKQSLERIGKMATETLGMQYAQEQPEWIAIPPDLQKQAERVRKELGQ